MQTMKWWRKILYALAVGTPCFFLSEGFFWARWRMDFNPISAVQTWLVYCFVTYTILVILDRFRVRNFWGVFLAGAVYGWLVEGVVVSTLYEDFPLGISFTGLAWHALFSVTIGLYLLPRLLRTARPGRIAWMAALAGAIYALWSLWWWLENPNNINNPLLWLLYSGGMALFSLLGYWAADRLSREHRFISSKAELIVLVVVWTIFFLISRFFSFGWGIFVLPPLMALTFAALHVGRKGIAQKETLALGAIRGPIPPVNLAILLLIPLTAVVIYTIAYMLGIPAKTNILFYIVLTPAGFIVYIIALLQMFRRKGTINPETETASTGE
jgi:hypothetical protein